MKVLVDMNLSPQWVPFLVDEGFMATHWSTVGDPRAADRELLEWARAEQHLVFTNDLDFGFLLATAGAIGPSVFQVRTLNLTPQGVGRDVVRVLRDHAEALLRGAIVTLDSTRNEARALSLATRARYTSRMSEIWESMFAGRRVMWGEEPTRSALLARDYFVARGAREILIPGVGYGRNAKPFVECGISVTGIEVSASAIAQARSELGLDFPIHHGSVEGMPFDDREYDGVFCYGLAFLLDAAGRAKFFADCHRQLRPGGSTIFTLISKSAPMYGQGPKLGEDWYERAPGLPMFFYDEASVARELGAYGITDVSEIDEPVAAGVSYPFYNVTCVKR